MARTALDMPVNIGSLEGRWSGFAPVLLAHDVMVGEGSSALRLDQVQVVPDIWASLLARDCWRDRRQVEVIGLQVLKGSVWSTAMGVLPLNTCRRC